MPNKVGDFEKQDIQQVIDWKGAPFSITLASGETIPVTYSVDARELLESHGATIEKNSDTGKRMWHTLNEETRNRLTKAAARNEPELPLGDTAA